MATTEFCGEFMTADPLHEGELFRSDDHGRTWIQCWGKVLPSGLKTFARADHSKASGAPLGPLEALDMMKEDALPEGSQSGFVVQLEGDVTVLFACAGAVDASAWFVALGSATAIDDAAAWARMPMPPASKSDWIVLDLKDEGEHPVEKRLRSTLEHGGLILVTYEPGMGASRPKKAAKTLKGKALQKDLLKWIITTIGKPELVPDPSEGFKVLKDGYILALLMNALQPKSIKKKMLKKRPKLKFSQLELLGKVLKAIRKYGIREDSLFAPVDLNDGKNFKAACICLDDLRRHAHHAGTHQIAAGAGRRASVTSVPTGKGQGQAAVYKWRIIHPDRDRAEEVYGGRGKMRHHDNLEHEYEQWKKTVRSLKPDAWAEANAGWMRRRFAQYVAAVTTLGKSCENKAIVGILRMQDELDDKFQPPKFGDMVIVYNPNAGKTGYKDFARDAELISASTIDKLTKFLTLGSSREPILRGFNMRRDGQDASQNDKSALNYCVCYHTMFRRSMTKALSAP